MKYINNIDVVNGNSNQMKDNISIRGKTKPITYRTAINPLCKDNYVPEHLGTIFTILRLSSYMLKIKTGRWSRVPSENRLCDCKSDMQIEEHIIKLCQISQPVRDNYTDINFSLPDIFLFRDYTRLCKALTEIYKSYV